jgi:cytochrome P450
VTLAAPRLDIDPFDTAFLDDPYPRHVVLRDAGAVVWLQPLGVFAMARHAEVLAALRDWEAFCSSRGVGLSDFATEAPWRPPSLLLETDPPIHDRTRKIMSRIASIPALRAVRARWAAEADTLVASLAAQGSFDAVRDLAEVFPMRVFPDLIGLPQEGRAHLLDYAAASFNAFGPRNAIFQESDLAAQAAIAWVNESCRRANLSTDGWGAAVFAAADRGDCTEQEAERLVRSFLSAGVDTTVSGIGNLMHAFAATPQAWRQLRADPALSTKAFEESLRWDSTVQIFFRTTTCDVTVDGVRIPEGSKVLLFLAAANRDPRRWEEPERFDVTRATSGHVAFGFGIHQCLGQMVARQEVDVLIAAMLRHFPVIEPAGAPVRRLNNTLHALASLPVRIR